MPFRFYLGWSDKIDKNRGCGAGVATRNYKLYKVYDYIDVNIVTIIKIIRLR